MGIAKGFIPLFCRSLLRFDYFMEKGYAPSWKDCDMRVCLGEDGRGCIL